MVKEERKAQLRAVPGRQTVGLLCLGLLISAYLSFGICKTDLMNLSVRAVALGTMMWVVLADPWKQMETRAPLKTKGQQGGTCANR